MPLARDTLLDAFDEIGEIALIRGDRLELAVYGGSALMLAGNFGFATEDVGVADVTAAQPGWLQEQIKVIGERNDWPSDWLNDAVSFHLSPRADRTADHVEFGSYPRGQGPYGLDIFVPTAEYMLALKLKAMRVLDPVKGKQETTDILNLLKITRTDSPEAAIEILRRYFPNSAKAPEKQLFLLDRLKDISEPADAPTYPSRGDRARDAGNSGRDRAR